MGNAGNILLSGREERGCGWSLRGTVKDKKNQNLTGDEGYAGLQPPRPRRLHTSLGIGLALEATD